LAAVRVGLPGAGVPTLTYATSLRLVAGGSSGVVRAAEEGEGPGAKLDAASRVKRPP
jgi:hypothetical protein